MINNFTLCGTIKPRKKLFSNKMYYAFTDKDARLCSNPGDFMIVEEGCTIKFKLFDEIDYTIHAEAGDYIMLKAGTYMLINTIRSYLQ